jgi:hypothetical protein
MFRLLFRNVSVAFIAAVVTGSCGSDKVRIKPTESELIISQQILTYTPLGSTPSEVLGFIGNLKHAHGPPKYDYYNHVIMVSLGHFGLNGETYVTWVFDSADKGLTKVSVGKTRDAL